MSEQTNNKYNRTGTGANKAVFSTFTEKQETVNTVKKKKKATFEMDADLHRRLKRYSADHDIKMVEIVEQALNDFLTSQQMK